MNRLSGLSRLWRRPRLAIGEGLSYVKYPYALEYGAEHAQLSNMVYAVLPVENLDSVEHAVGFIAHLKGRRQYQAQALSQNSAEAPNPATTLIGPGESESFHPVAMRLQDLSCFIPSNSYGQPGALWGHRVEAGSYRLYVRLIVDGELWDERRVYDLELPADMLNKAKLPPDLEAIRGQSRLTWIVAGETSVEG